MNEATRLTRVLQIAFPIFVIGSVIVAWVSAMAAISMRIATGEAFVASYVVVFLGVWTILALLLAYGSLKTWRWAFWGNVVLALFSFAVPPKGNPFGWLAYVSDAVLVVLIGLAAAAVVRGGPWGLKQSSERRGGW